jgi:hypothetical protein
MKNCIVSFAMDLTKITKAKIKTDEKGRKWLYLQASIQIEEDQFGNQVAVWENQSKAERETSKRNYLGNGKITFFDSGSTVLVSPTQTTETDSTEDSELPF